MNEPIRHVEMDCSTGEERWRESEPDEAAAILARQKAHSDRTAAEYAQKQADLQLLRARAKDDPAFAALARILKVDLPAE